MNDVGITELEKEEEFIHQWVALEERLQPPAVRYSLVHRFVGRLVLHISTGLTFLPGHLLSLGSKAPTKRLTGLRDGFLTVNLVGCGYFQVLRNLD